MTRHTDEVRADGRLAYPELAARDTVTDGHRILELKPLVHPSGLPAVDVPVWISEEIPHVVVRLIRLGGDPEQYKGSCYFARQFGAQINTYAPDLPTALGRLSTYLHEQLGTPITVTIPDPELELAPRMHAGSCHYCGAGWMQISPVQKITEPDRVETVFECVDLEECRQRRSQLAGLPCHRLYPEPGQRPTAIELAWAAARSRPPRTFADVLKAIGRRLIGGDYHGPDADISDTDYVVFPNAGINLDQLFPDDPPAERPDLTGQADVAAELDHAMRAIDPELPIEEHLAALRALTEETVAPFVYATDVGTTRIGAADRARWAENPPLADIAPRPNPAPGWTTVGLRDVPLTLSEYMADPPTRDTRTHFTGTYVTPPPPELRSEELSSELGAIMDLMAPVRLLRDLCSGEDEHRLDVFDSFLRDLASRVTEIAAALPGRGRLMGWGELPETTPTSRAKLEANAAARRDLLAPTRDILARLTARLDELDNPEDVLLALSAEALCAVVRRRQQRTGATAPTDLVVQAAGGEVTCLASRFLGFVK